MILNDRQTFAANQKASEEGKTQPAIKWYLDVIANDTSALEIQFFRIEDDQVLKLLGYRCGRDGYDTRWTRSDRVFDKLKPKPTARPIVHRSARRYDAHILQASRTSGAVHGAGKWHRSSAECGTRKRGTAPRVLPPLTSDGSWQTFTAVEDLAKQNVSEQFAEQLKAKGTSLDKLTPEQRAGGPGPYAG